MCNDTKPFITKLKRLLEILKYEFLYGHPTWYTTVLHTQVIFHKYTKLPYGLKWTSEIKWNFVRLPKCSSLIFIRSNQPPIKNSKCLYTIHPFIQWCRTTSLKCNSTTALPLQWSWKYIHFALSNAKLTTDQINSNGTFCIDISFKKVLK